MIQDFERVLPVTCKESPSLDAVFDSKSTGHIAQNSWGQWGMVLKKRTLPV